MIGARRLSGLLGLAVIGALQLSHASSWTATSDERKEQLEHTSTAQRLFGPLATIIADIELIRSEGALERGDLARAYAHLDRALRLDPESEEAWCWLAYHLIFERASTEREADPERRARHVQAGLELLQRGMTRVRKPAVLEFQLGLALVSTAARAEDGDFDWPGGPNAARKAARAAFERAALRGHAAARELLAPIQEPERH